MTDDPYVDARTGILRNRRGFKTQDELTYFEDLASQRGSLAWIDAPESRRFDLAHLQSIHRYLFADVYEWAGALRTTSLTKGQSMFAAPDQIEREADNLFKHLQQRCNKWEGLSAQELAGQAAYYLGEVNALHPFREGNGRTQRIFIDQLVREYGHQFQWGHIKQHEMLDASIATMRREYEPMTRLLELSIDKLPERDYSLDLFKNEARHDRQKKGPSFER